MARSLAVPPGGDVFPTFRRAAQAGARRRPPPAARAVTSVSVE